jgi:isochorismate synthase
MSAAQRADVADAQQAPVGLFDLYPARSGFVMVQASRGLAAVGDSTSVAVAAGPDQVQRAATQVREALGAGGAAHVAVGAIPFDGGSDAVLYIPERVVWRENLVLRPPPPPTARRVVRIRAEPEPGAYQRMVADALRGIEAGSLEKVVLARTLLVESDTRLVARVLARRLRAVDPDCYVFAASLPSGGDLIGASPELLLRRRGGAVFSDPLAGTARRSRDPVEDARVAQTLMDAVKERREHRLTAEAVADSLAPFCVSLEVDAQPSLSATATLWHLRTSVRGRLREDAPDALSLAAALHPTPAVCGTPTDLARQVIRELEPFERGFYAGIVGWVDGRGDGEWAVTLRCAEVSGRAATLYAGAGIVAGSDPVEEDRETEAKFDTVLRAIGAEQPER